MYVNSKENLDYISYINISKIFLLNHLNTNLNYKYKKLKMLQNVLVRKRLNFRWKKKYMNHLNISSKKKNNFLNNFKNVYINYYIKNIMIIFKWIKNKYSFILKIKKNLLNICFLKDVYFFRRARIFNTFFKYRNRWQFNYFK
uniref:Uncharacterized protein n=1 Tax=Cafileria marina TaxID=2557541 RepID=A0A5B9ISY3_9STRA|nr:hypothetical protein [Cafileria marina]QEF30255.1 hypothetical protein [Cafileria marina]